MPKTKNKIMAILLCLTMLVYSLFILSACKFGEEEKTDPNRIIKDDFTLAEKIITYQTMLAKMYNLDAFSYHAVVEHYESGNKVNMESFAYVTKTKAYYLDVASDNTYQEYWYELNDKNETIYMHQESSQSKYEKTSVTLSDDCENLVEEQILKGVFFPESVDSYKKMTEYADGRIVLEVEYLEEDSCQYIISYEINKDGLTTKLSQTQIYDNSIDTYEMEYNYGAVVIPPIPTNVEWSVM